CVRFHWAPAKVAVPVNDVPIFVGDQSLFISDPSDIPVLKQGHISEHESIGLIRAQFLNVSRKVVDMSGAASAVEPELHEFAVMLRELIEFLCVVFDVRGIVAVAWLVPIPG